MARPIVAGNWKMNGLADALVEADLVAEALRAEAAACRVAICPPSTLIERLARSLAGSPVETGGQDCHTEVSGAYTGDVSAAMLADSGARLVIIGHSERRGGHGETDETVAGKARAALAAGLEPIICVGESLAERDAGAAVDRVVAQVRGSTPDSLAGAAFAIAYEPIWAIGTGRTAALEDISQMHSAIRRALVERFGEAGGDAPILYGGSVKPDNAAAILSVEEVGGALVGGASLKSADFLPIIRACG
jgi:triosephosphate isomerase (TIM)